MQVTSNIISARVARGIAVMCAAVWVASTHPAHAGVNVWTSHGPGVADVTALAIDPTTPSTLYAATYGDGVFKSPDGGDSWNTANTGLPDNISITALAIEPTTPDTLYAATGACYGTFGCNSGDSSSGDGVYKSTDGGDTWNAINTGLPDNASITALAIDPTTPGTLYAATARGALGGAVVYKSTDGGNSWNTANTGLPDGNHIAVLATDPTTPGTLYAGAYRSVFKSTDGGDTWNAADPVLLDYTFVTALAIDPTMPGTLYAGSGACVNEGSCSGSVYKSTDGGDTWNAANNGLPGVFVTALAIDLTHTLYAATTFYTPSPYGAVFKSTDGASSWQAVNAGLQNNTDVRALAIDPSTPSTLYAVANIDRYDHRLAGGVYKSTDAANSWAAANRGLQTGNTFVGALTIDPTIPSTLYAAGVGGVDKSTDGGDTWNAAYTDFYPLAIDPTTIPSTIYAKTSDPGVYKSTDGGDTWNAANSGLPDSTYVSALAIDPATPRKLYVMSRFGVYKSTDGGDTWNAANSGLPNDYYPDNFNVRELAIDPNTPSTLYVSVHVAITGSHVYKSTDGGDTWNAASTGLPNATGGSAYVLAIDPTMPGTLYAATVGAVYKSTDGGDAWNAASTGLPDDSVFSALAIDPTTPSTLYAATYRGVYKSTDGASSWQTFNAGLSNTSVLALAIDPTTPRRLYAATSGGGVFAIEQVPSSCVGDCSGTDTVTVNDLITLVNIALGTAQPSACMNGIASGVTVDVTLLVQAVNHALEGCPTCGSGRVDGDEECDDGNTVGGDGCAANCTGEDRRTYTIAGGTCLDGSNDGASCQTHADCPGRILPGYCSSATVQGEVLGLGFLVSGQEVLTTGRARPSSPDATLPVVIKAADVHFQPVRRTGLACVCVRAVAMDAFGPGNAGVGEIGCGPAGLPDVDVTSSRDHDISDEDPTCATGTLDPGLNACVGPLDIHRSGGLGPRGSAVIRLSVSVAAIWDSGTCATETQTTVCRGGANLNWPSFAACDVECDGECVPAKGADGIPCTADDAAEVRIATLHLTTGTARAEILDANGTPGLRIGAGAECSGGPCLAEIQGAPFDCEALAAETGGGVEGASLVSAFPFIRLSSDLNDNCFGDSVTTGVAPLLVPRLPCGFAS